MRAACTSAGETDTAGSVAEILTAACRVAKKEPTPAATAHSTMATPMMAFFDMGLSFFPIPKQFLCRQRFSAGNQNVPYPRSLPDADPLSCVFAVTLPSPGSVPDVTDVGPEMEAATGMMEPGVFRPRGAQGTPIAGSEDPASNDADPASTGMVEPGVFPGLPALSEAEGSEVEGRPRKPSTR